MTVLPCSQLTMRMVPASTSRRNAATIIGTTKKTPTSTAPMMTSGFFRNSVNMESSGRKRGGSGLSNGASVAVGVDLFDAYYVARANANARAAVSLVQRAEDLHHVAIDLDRDQALAVLIEVRHGLRVVLNRAFQGLGRTRGEPEHEVPQRVYQ